MDLYSLHATEFSPCFCCLFRRRIRLALLPTANVAKTLWTPSRRTYPRYRMGLMASTGGFSLLCISGTGLYHACQPAHYLRHLRNIFRLRLHANQQYMGCSPHSFFNNNLAPVIAGTYTADVLQNQTVSWSQIPWSLVINGLLFGLFLLAKPFRKKKGIYAASAFPMNKALDPQS